MDRQVHSRIEEEVGAPPRLPESSVLLDDAHDVFDPLAIIIYLAVHVNLELCEYSAIFTVVLRKNLR